MKNEFEERKRRKTNGASIASDVSTATATVKKRVEFFARMAAFEEFLRRHLPFVPFNGLKDRAGRQNVVLGWDGIRIVPVRIKDLPPPSDNDLEQALVGLREDALVVLLRGGISEKPPF